MTDPQAAARKGPGPGQRRKRTLPRPAAVLAAVAVVLAGLVSCAKQPPPSAPVLHTTQAFDAIFGEVPSLPLPGPSYATVAYFPSSLEPGKFRPVPIFSVEQGKEEALTVRTVIRGIGTAESPVDASRAGIIHPFPAGTDLTSLAYDGGTARIAVGGSFRAASLFPRQMEMAAQALALTVSQFGKADRVEVTDVSGEMTFGAEAVGAEVVDIGPPKILALIAVREEEEKQAMSLSVLFDRPVFVEDAAFSDAGRGEPYPGKVYSTGFGMNLEFHPEGGIVFDPAREIRMRVAVRDGKGRETDVDQTIRPKTATRH